MTDNMSHSDLDAALSRADADAGASEAHGILCGMLCAEQGADRAAWLAEVLGAAPAQGDVLAGEAVQQLDQLLDRTLKQLDDGMMGLRLLLPDDERPLADRVVALGTWCEGFLLGISRAQSAGQAKLSDDVRELLSDLVEITKVDPAELDDGQDDERSYTEVVEYVRMGVLLAFEQASSSQPPKQAH